MDTPPHDGSRAWIPELVDRVASFLPASDACSLRLVNRATAAQLQRYATIHLSQPVHPAIFAARWSAPDACRNLTSANRRLLVSLTAASGVVENLAVASQAAGFWAPRAAAVQAAAAAGRLDCCRWLSERLQLTHKEQLEVLLAAARGGHTVCCQWVLDSGFKPGPGDWPQALTAAATGGSQDACAWCLDPSRGGVGAWNDAAVRLALREGHVALSAWLAAQRPAGACAGIMASWGRLLAAARGCGAAAFQRLCEADGVLESMLDPHKRSLLMEAVVSPTDWRAKADYLYQQGGWSPDDALEVPPVWPRGDAAMPERLGWLQAHGCRLTGVKAARVLVAAVARANAEGVAWLLRAGVRPVVGGGGGEGEAAGQEAEATVSGWSEAVRKAAEEGSVEVLRLLIEAGCPLGEADRRSALAAAARGGHLAAIRLLTSAYGIGGSRRVASELFKSAVASGSVEVLAWLRTRGCGIAPGEEARELELMWAAAASAGCEAALEFLATRAGCPLPEDGGRACGAALEGGDLSTLRTLQRLGLPCGRGRGLLHKAACARLPLPVLEELLAMGCEPESWKEVARGVQESWPPCEERRRLEVWLAQQRQREGGRSRGDAGTGAARGGKNSRAKPGPQGSRFLGLEPPLWLAMLALAVWWRSWGKS
ncbi:hypothetical protein HYH03_005768 [Edaphochlamys debaryana]|uniref:Ankyrin repeat domain-containing protein n=1 Tax=Edaphochlamys debaryana TaxID=47281 RepID=A0A836C1S8_9CHLO|nr:hypothetical protein HYH03_005768 [Edaphochlamys debaryana]|eukprot:KAG2496167.1 hypothetical protein HYH03_005768 [Edaphochlamys debaryana]